MCRSNRPLVAKIFTGKLLFLYVLYVYALKNAMNWEPCAAAVECSTVVDCTITRHFLYMLISVCSKELQLLWALVHTITVLYLSYCVEGCYGSSRYNYTSWFIFGFSCWTLSHIYTVFICCDVHISRVKCLQIRASMQLYISMKYYMHNNIQLHVAINSIAGSTSVVCATVYKTWI